MPSGQHYVRYPQQEKIYHTTWQLKLPETIDSWVQQPLLSLNGTEIQKILKNDIVISRNAEGAVFYDSRTKSPYHQFEYIQLFDIIGDLRFDQVLSSQEFDNGKYPYQQKLQIVTFGGLIAELDV